MPVQTIIIYAMKKLFFLFLLFFFLFYFQSFAQGWFPVQTSYSKLNVRNTIATMCVDTSCNLYVAGGFLDSTNIFGKCYVAKWDNAIHEWSKLGTGVNALKANNGIYSICVDKKQNIYAAGAFTNDSSLFSGYQYVAKWNGSTWSELGTGIGVLNANGPINSICIDDSGNVYAAGHFRNSSFLYYVAKWNGTSWNDLGGLNADLFINSICVDDSFNVYAAGNFTDGSGHTYVAKYSPATGTWGELGTGFDSGAAEVVITSIVTDTPNHVYAAVNFGPGILHSNIFKWDGSDWNQLGSLNGNNWTNVIYKGDSGFVYAGGDFTNTTEKQYVAQWNPQTGAWSELGTGINALNAKGSILTICIDRNRHIYVAGAFTDSISFTDNYNYVAEYGPASLNIESIKGDDIEIKVYPNPTRETVNIKCYKGAENYSISYELLDCIGRVWNSGDCTAEDTKIDISRLPIGLYILAIGEVEFKIIKN